MRILALLTFTLYMFFSCSSSSPEEKLKNLLGESLKIDSTMQILKRQSSEDYSRILSSVEPKYKTAALTVLTQNQSEISFGDEAIDGLNGLLELGGVVSSLFQDQKLIAEAENLLTPDINRLKDYKKEYKKLKIKLKKTELACYEILEKNEDIMEADLRIRLLSAIDRKYNISGEYEANEGYDIWSIYNDNFNANNETMICPVCNGEGWVLEYDNNGQVLMNCGKCRGHGYLK